MEPELPQRNWKRIAFWMIGIFIVVTILLGVVAAVSFSGNRDAVVSSVSSDSQREEPIQDSGAFTKSPIVFDSVQSKEAVRIATDDDPSYGPKDAKVTVVEFSDFECPFCRQAYPIIRELMVKYGDRVRFIYRDFPIDSVHEFARKAAEAGECADDQGKFWQLHDRIFQNQEHMKVDDLKRYARAAGLNGERFDYCLDNNQFANEVEQDFKDGIALGVQGTPTWFINGYKVQGVIPRDKFVQILETLVK